MTDALAEFRERERAAERAANAEFRADRARRDEVLKARDERRAAPLDALADAPAYCFLCRAYCSAPQHAANARKRTPRAQEEKE